MAHTKQLAAIMMTDFISTDDPNQDQARAADFIKKNRSVQESLIEKHHGKWFEDSMNGPLACFDNTLDAINCARELQTQLKDEPELKVCINIHLGEVTLDDNKIIDEGLSIATKVKSNSDREGIFISEAIYNTVRHNQRDDLTSIPVENQTQVNGSVNVDDPAEGSKVEKELSMKDTR